ncbi:MAG: phosphate/phosphite/phosphonate ABC transporter substrate-binding protein [Gemmatales bacterium]|nr:phosphate/phosphite/phosphonate ABC transporter substrate-binding protein [Gemmatales bacterium]MDW8221425.1 PhnD/SsuA/transferrin family substrate-binding protein [Gemmatales bacterium]
MNRKPPEVISFRNAPNLQYCLAVLMLSFCLAAGGDAFILQEPIGVGMIASLFDQTDEKTILAQMQPFADVIGKRLGVRGEFVVVRDVEHAAQLFDERRIQVIVLHGPEYGWLKQLDKEIRPLLLATASVPKLQAVLLVNQKSEAKTPEDLKDKTLVLASRLPQHLRLYLERRFPQPVDKIFRILEVKTAEDALEAVIEDKADLTLVSNIQAEVYRQQRPGRFKRLRELEISPDFPLPVVAYKPQKGLEDLVENFRKALLTAKETPEGRQTLVLWRIEGFQDAPADYEEQAARIAKTYPFKASAR